MTEENSTGNEQLDRPEQRNKDSESEEEKVRKKKSGNPPSGFISSRREFLKKSGGGVVGVGLAAFASGFVSSCSEDSANAAPAPTGNNTSDDSNDNYTVNDDGSIEGTITNDKTLSNLEGENLTITNGTLNAEGAIGMEAAPGELQDALDEAGSLSQSTNWGGRVVVNCKSNSVYSNPPYRIPSAAILNCNGAIFRSGGDDVNILELDVRTDVIGPATINTRPVDPYRSDAIVLDATTASNPPYAMNGHRTANLWGTFRIFGLQPGVGTIAMDEGNALALRGGPNNGEYITHCYLGDLQINGFNNGVLCDARGFLNDNRMSWDITKTNRGFYHIGTKEAKLIVGQSHMQMGGMQTAFRNDTDRKSIRWWGHAEDPHWISDNGRNVFDGPRMKLFGTHRLNLSHNDANYGTGTTFHGIGVQRGVSGEPLNPQHYWMGERVITEDGVYMKNPYQGHDAWIQIASGSFLP